MPSIMLPTVRDPLLPQAYNLERRRSQSEQTFSATTASPARHVSFKADGPAEFASAMHYQPTIVTKTTPVSSPKSALAVKTAPRRVFFSTPQAPRPPRQAPVKVSLYTSPVAVNKEIPPPYTPIGQFSNFGPPAAPLQIPGRALNQPIGHMRMGPSYTGRPTASPALQAITAASQALRLNLGLEHGHQPALDSLHPAGMTDPQMLAPPYGFAAPAPELLAQLPGAPIVQPQSVYNKTPSTSVQTQLLSSLFPVSGQVQPAVSQSTSLPPVVNTGAKGPMKVQPGDWSCLVCSFVNWRRRKYCMRCCPFAEGNATEADAVNTTPPPVSDIVPQLYSGMPLHPNMPLPNSPPRFADIGSFVPGHFRPEIQGFGLPMLAMPQYTLMQQFPQPGAYLPMQPAYGYPFAPAPSFTEHKRQLTPSPTNSDASAFSAFAFSGPPSIASSPETLAASPPSSEGSRSPNTPKIDAFDGNRSSPKLAEAFSAVRLSTIA